MTGLESDKLVADAAMEYNNQTNEDTEEDDETEESDSDDENYGVYSCTTAEEYQPVEVKTKKKTKGGKAGVGGAGEDPEDGSGKAADEDWGQEVQKALEAALSQFPKGTTDRWDRIAAKVPGKSKEECMLRFKRLAEMVKAKKLAAAGGGGGGAASE